MHNDHWKFKFSWKFVECKYALAYFFKCFMIFFYLLTGWQIQALQTCQSRQIFRHDRFFQVRNHFAQSSLSLLSQSFGRFLEDDGCVGLVCTAALSLHLEIVKLKQHIVFMQVAQSTKWMLYVTINYKGFFVTGGGMIDRKDSLLHEPYWMLVAQ